MKRGQAAAVYVMEDDEGRRKVGHSNNPLRRSFEINGSARPLRILHASDFSSNASKIERMAQRLLTLAGKHIEGELFSATLEECVGAIERAERIVSGVEPVPAGVQPFGAPSKTTVVAFRMQDGVVKELRDIAEAEHRKLANYLAMVIEKHLADVREKKAAKERKKQ